MPEMTPKEMKEVLKLAVKEWLDEKWSALGKWTLHGLAALGLAMLAFLLFISNGWGSK